MLELIMIIRTHCQHYHILDGFREFKKLYNEELF